MLTLKAYKNKTQTGYYFRCNYTALSSESTNVTTSYFMYADRPLTLKGTNSVSQSDNGISFKVSEVFDVNLKTGWNEICEKVELNVTSTSSTTTTTYSSTIPTDLKWVYIANSDIASVKKQAKSVFPIKHSSFFGR